MEEGLRVEVEQMILDLLGRQMGTDPATLREELYEQGAELPVDSMIAVETLVEVEERFGVHVIESAESARCMRSVVLYTDLICRLVQEEQHESS